MRGMEIEKENGSRETRQIVLKKKERERRPTP